MSLRHMEVFHAVYVNGTVVGAARALNVSQPSISKVLAHAEIRLGFALFRRLQGRLQPTDEAHVLFREINELQGRLNSVQQTAQNLKSELGGYLRLAVLPSLGLATVPSAVTRLLQTRPSIEVDVQTMHHKNVLHSLIERDSELAIGFDPPTHPRLESEQFGEGELVVFFRKGEIADPPARIQLSTLADRKLIGLSSSGPIGNLFSNETAAASLSFEEQLSVRTFYVGAGLVRAGAGIAVIDEFTARASLTGELDFRPLDPPIRFGVHVIFLADRPLSKLGKEFVAALSKTIEDEQTTGRAYNGKL